MTVRHAARAATTPEDVAAVIGDEARRRLPLEAALDPVTGQELPGATRRYAVWLEEFAYQCELEAGVRETGFVVQAADAAGVSPADWFRQVHVTQMG